MLELGGRWGGELLVKLIISTQISAGTLTLSDCNKRTKTGEERRENNTMAEKEECETCPNW